MRQESAEDLRERASGVRRPSVPDFENQTVHSRAVAETRAASTRVSAPGLPGRKWNQSPRTPMAGAFSLGFLARTKTHRQLSRQPPSQLFLLVERASDLVWLTSSTFMVGLNSAAGLFTFLLDRTTTGSVSSRAVRLNLTFFRFPKRCRSRPSRRLRRGRTRVARRHLQPR